MMIKFTERPWVFASGNRGKLAELQEFFAGTSIALEALSDHASGDSVEESGATIKENARIKASVIARRLGCYALADDTGLFVDVLGGAPGVRTARFAGDEASPEANRNKLLKAMQGIRPENRQASFRCALVLADPTGSIVAEAEGACEGLILEEPEGESEFPYDPLFWIPSHQSTLCQLDEKSRKQINHRTMAAHELLGQLDQLTGNGFGQARNSE